jgi:hypothetical protein
MGTRMGTPGPACTTLARHQWCAPGAGLQVVDPKAAAKAKSAATRAANQRAAYSKASAGTAKLSAFFAAPAKKE